MAECLLHLNIVGDRYVHLIEKAVADARARGLEGQSPVGYGWLGKWILANTEPPPKRKSKSARATTPAVWPAPYGSDAHVPAPAGSTCAAG